MVAKQLRFMGAYVKINLAIALEYRASLISQVLGMFINDIIWVAFWVLYFNRFPVVRGWQLEDVVVLWASITVSLGLAFGIFSNCLRIPQLVTQGQLDYYLALPKDVLLHLLVSQIRLINLGDVLFGPLLLVVMVKLTWAKALIFVVTSLLATAVLVGFCLVVGSLTFYIGNADTLGGQMINALIHFSTYPTPIFDGVLKLILFTLIPAGLIASLPVELMRQFDPVKLLGLLGGALLFVTVGVLLFRRGLRRYESGNLMALRS